MNIDNLIENIVTKKQYLAYIKKNNYSIIVACDCSYNKKIEQSKFNACQLVATGYKCFLCKKIYPYKINLNIGKLK